MITLAILNNQPVVRAGIRSMLKDVEDIQILGEAGNSDELQALVTQSPPRVLLMDLKILGTSPVEIAKWMQTNSPDTALLVFTAEEQDIYLAVMLDAGAVGFLNTETSAENLIAAIRRTDEWEILFDDNQLKRIEEWQKVAGNKWRNLSKRQKQVLQRLAQGFSKADVAAHLDIKPRMVDYHIGEFLKVLKVKSLTDAVNWLHKHFPENSGSIT
jgi:DNA-binding NarL/FixJ family response regulator